MNELGLAGLIGVFLPLVVSLIKGRSWPRWLSVLLAVAVSLVSGIVITAADGNIDLSGDIVEDPGQLLAAAAASFTAATVVYQTFFRGSTIDDALTSFPSG